MSLGRLLTSGKSLVGLQNNDCRYEMRPKNLLPKFGSDKNPFLTAKSKAESLQAEFSRKLPTVTRTLTPAEQDAAKLNETKPLPAIKAFKSEETAPVKPIAKTKMLNRLSRWLNKLNPLNWRRAASRAEKKSAGRFAKTPVQTELSLEKIKVLRNDLTEADVEVVPVKISVQPKQQPAAPAAKVAETAELIKT
jgi:hypothetical protein